MVVKANGKAVILGPGYELAAAHQGEGWAVIAHPIGYPHNYATLVGSLEKQTAERVLELLARRFAHGGVVNVDEVLEVAKNGMG